MCRLRCIGASAGVRTGAVVPSGRAPRPRRAGRRLDRRSARRVCTCGGLPAPRTVRNCTSAGATPLRAAPCGRLATSAGFNAPQPRPTGHPAHPCHRRCRRLATSAGFSAPQPRPTGHPAHPCLPGGSRGHLGHAPRPDNHATRPAAASAPPEMRGRPRYGRRATYSTSTTRASIRSQSDQLDQHDQSLDTVAERPTRPARPAPPGLDTVAERPTRPAQLTRLSPSAAACRPSGGRRSRCPCHAALRAGASDRFRAGARWSRDAASGAVSARRTLTAAG